MGCASESCSPIRAQRQRTHTADDLAEALTAGKIIGLMDGEACFGLYRRPGSNGWSTMWSIELRQDDAEVLHEIQRVLGVGAVYLAPARPKGNAGPTVRLRTEGLDGCHRLAQWIDRWGGLRSKKHDDYLVWRAAVEIRLGYPIGTEGSDTRTRAQRTADMSEHLPALKAEMSRLKAYRASTIHP